MVADFLIVFISLFVIIDPLVSIPVFMSLFGRSERRKQRRAALDAAVAALLILVVFSLFGSAILGWMSISISAFMIAGGILLLYLSFDFIRGEIPKTRTIEDDPAEVIVPVATPLLAGPGAITTSIYFTHVYGAGLTLSAIVLVMVACFVLLYFSNRISRTIGNNGLKIITRIMGMLTAAIAIGLIEKALVLWGVLAI